MPVAPAVPLALAPAVPLALAPAVPLALVPAVPLALVPAAPPPAVPVAVVPAVPDPAAPMALDVPAAPVFGGVPPVGSLLQPAPDVKIVRIAKVEATTREPEKRCVITGEAPFGGTARPYRPPACRLSRRRANRCTP
jgi:hypothetical protein